MRCLQRLCGIFANIKVSTDEDALISNNISEHNKKYLVRRKTMLSIVFVSQLFEFCYTLYKSIIAITAMENASDELYMIALLLSLFMLLNDLVNCILLFLARYHWPDYKKSSKYVIMSGILTVFLPLLVFYIPFRKYIDISTLFDGDSVSYYGVIADILQNIFSKFVTPALLLIQTVVNQSNSLVQIYTKSNMFKMISSILLCVYIPLYFLINSFAYQLTISPLHIYFVILYTILLALPLFFEDKVLQVVSFIMAICTLIVAYYMLDLFGLNIFTMIMNSYIRYLHLTMIVQDLMINLLTKYFQQTHIDEPNGLFKTNEQYNNIELGIIS
jgi:hypothetical protein